MKALLLLGHGSHFNAESSSFLRKQAQIIKSKKIFSNVYTAFWKEEPSFARVFDAIEELQIDVLPIFMSEGYFTNQIIPRELRLNQITNKKINYLPPIGSHPKIFEIILSKAYLAGLDQSSSLVILGHGTKRSKTSEINIIKQATLIKALKVAKEVFPLFIDQEPGLHQLFNLTNNQDIIIVPFFAAEGWHVEETIPYDLNQDILKNKYTGNIRFTKAVGTDPLVIDLILDMVKP